MTIISWIYHKDYDIPLPKNHRFTSSKFSDLFKLLSLSNIYENCKIFSPEKVSIDELLIAHDKNYILKIKNGTLEKHEERILGLNWSKILANRSFLAVNGTLMTGIEALKNGVACHLGGGTHHAHYDYGSGYCVFNDLAYSSLQLINKKIVKKILIFDCDVHQGDGTASILSKFDNIFTCSIHCKKNFPTKKSISNLDVELNDNLNNEKYLKVLKDTLNHCISLFKPDLVFYDAGVDIHKNDYLGKLNVNDDGLLNRDLIVINFFKKLNIPIATVIGGGYSKDNLELANRHSVIFNAVDKVFN